MTDELAARAVRFARWVFRIAGIYGLIVVVPAFFLEDLVVSMSPPALTHPEHYYGFLSITVAWQVAFLVIATDPLRYRWMMVPAMVEKFLFGGVMAMLYLNGRASLATLGPVVNDTVLGIFFVAAFVRTRRAAS